MNQESGHEGEAASTDGAHFDVIIMGAGISGIGAAYHLQANCPTKTYAILEGRERMGGTWDFFRYPGIRSDSDMYTLGFSFRPWTDAAAIADGPAILRYVHETAEAHGIDRKIHYRHVVERIGWSTKDARWSVEARRTDSRETVRLTCGFVFMCGGYYDYDEGYTPRFEGMEQFAGTIVHPQKWTDDLEYEGKRIVVIGSGATAVTLVPSLAKAAAHVTMLQRSPTYIVSLPSEDVIANGLRSVLPAEWAYSLTRWKNVFFFMAFYQFCRRFPAGAKSLLIGGVRHALGSAFDIETHFTPRYAPWDQRLCLVPNSDLFEAIKAGRASVVTDEIERFTERGLALRSGAELEADLIVTATGLQLRFLGGAELRVDGELVEPSKTLAYRGMMLSDVPNLAMALGYTNASWTLKVDLTCEYACRLINHMDANGYAICCPRRKDPSLKEEPIITLNSGYIQRAAHKLPKQGSFAPWRLYNNYALDVISLRFGRVDDSAMEFSSATGSPSE